MGVSGEDGVAPSTPRQRIGVLDVTRADLHKCTVGRLELLQWANAQLQLDYSTIQDFADGIAFCQILDVVSPNAVPLQRVKFDACGIEDNRKNMRCESRHYT